jgi:hypothetical protein
MRDLRVHRGYPVPWFVADVDGEPDFRIVDGPKMVEAIKGGLCWICGKRLGRGDRFAFVVGPMCAVNRISAEPPQHVECARFAARACPFLVRPHAKRRESDLPDGHHELAGHMIRRNPGVSLVWITRSCTVIRTNTGLLFQMGRPVKVEAWREARPATSGEVAESVDSGTPVLREAAQAEGGLAPFRLQQQLEKTRKLLGIG